MTAARDTQHDHDIEDHALTPVHSASGPRRPRRQAPMGPLIRQAAVASLEKLHPRVLVHNPVIFVTEVGSVISTCYFVASLLSKSAEAGFLGAIAAWLWFTVLFANFAEALAEGRGRAQAAALRKARRDVEVRRFKPAYQAMRERDLPHAYWLRAAVREKLQNDAEGY